MRSSSDDQDPRDSKDAPDRTTGEDQDELDLDRPMLILGEGVEEVEDLTPELLRRRRQEAFAEIEAQRAKAAAELERTTAEAARELTRQQRQLDRRERASGRPSAGRNSTAASAAEPTPPLAERGLNNSGWAMLVLLVAAIGLVAAVLSALRTDGPAAFVRAVTEHDAPRQASQQLVLDLDQATAEHLVRLDQAQASGEVTGAEGASAGAAALTTQFQRIDDQAGNDGYLQRRTAPRLERLFSADRLAVLTAWEELRVMASSEVSPGDLQRAYDSSGYGNTTGVAWSAVAVAALFILLLLAVPAKAWLSVALLALALAAAGGLTWLALPGSEQSEAAERHTQAVDRAQTIAFRQASDLEVAYGLRNIAGGEAQEFWELDYLAYELDGVHQESTADYQLQREKFATTTTEQATDVAAVELTAAGQALYAELLEGVTAARQELAARADEGVPVGRGSFGFGVAGLALAVTAVILGRGRSRSGGGREDK